MNGRSPYSGFAPGKLLLFGEHAAVFGYPAVGVSLDRGLRISVTPADGISIRLARPAGGDVAAGLSAFAAFVADTLGSPADDGPVSPAGGAITVDSDLPISSGFGSSAALCTAIAEWSLPDPQVSGHDRSAVWRRAHRLEAFFHGTPSGIDTGLSSLGGVRTFRFSTPGALPESAALSADLPALVVGAIPRERSTRDLVAGVRSRLSTEPSTVRPIFDRLGALADAAIGELAAERNHAAGMAPLVADAHHLLRDLGVSTPLTDGIIDRGVRAGALAGKLSGAGGGGAFYLVCPDAEVAARVAADLDGTLPPGSVCFHMG